MGCCKCSCTKKLKHVDQVIHDYDPQKNFLNYDVTTVWINRKTKRAWLLVSKEGGIAVWQPIPLEESAINKIILDCGEVTPNENGEIIHEATCGARTVAKDCIDLCINVETDWGLTGGGNVCVGEKIKLGIDKENTNLVTSNSTNVEDGDNVVFDGTSGKVIKKGSGIFKIKESQADKNAGLEVIVPSGNGIPYIKLQAGDYFWNAQVDPSDNSLGFYNSDNQTIPLFKFLKNGVIYHTNQTAFAARLGRTPQFAQATDYQLGSNKAFTTIYDIDGTNTSAGNFFPGDANGNGAYYITTYDNVKYLIGYNFIVDTSITHPDGIRYTVTMWYVKSDGSLIAKFPSTGRIPPQSSFQTIGKTQPIRSIKDAKIYWTVNVIVSAQPYINAFEDSNPLSFENYVGGYILP